MASTNLMQKFGYLIEKINAANFDSAPFSHIIIDDFLSKEHYHEITKADEINFPKQESAEGLIEYLKTNGYAAQNFPGCTTSEKDYLYSINNNYWPVDSGIMEGFGMTFRLLNYKNETIRELIEFLNTPVFQKCLLEKFSLEQKEYKIETAVQKYLHGYEISPHPDIRRKALTYMLNINPFEGAEDMDIHTYLLKFTDSKSYLKDFWKHNLDIDRCWVPWSWCETVKKTNKNNSIVIFAPSNDSMHAVKLNYDHLAAQRTQVYGNVWHKEETVKYALEYKQIDLRNHMTDIENKYATSRFAFIPTPIKKLAKKILKK
ncbi:MAG: hypothetical protein AB8B74_04205 [Crocinitomicaceae bacterium]